MSFWTNIARQAVGESDPIDVLRNLGMPERFNTINQNLLVLALTEAPNRIPERVAKALNEQYPIGTNYDSDVLVFYGDALFNIAFMSKLRDIMKLSIQDEDRAAIRAGLGIETNRYLVLGESTPACVRLAPLSQQFNLALSNATVPGAGPGTQFSCDRTVSAILGAIYVQYGNSAIPDVADWISKTFPIDALIEKMRYNRGQGSPYVRPESGIALRVGGAAAATAGAVAAAAGLGVPQRAPLPYPPGFDAGAVDESNYSLTSLDGETYVLPLTYKPSVEGDGFAARYVMEKYTPLRLYFTNQQGVPVVFIADSNGNETNFKAFSLDPNNPQDIFAFLVENGIFAPEPKRNSKKR